MENKKEINILNIGWVSRLKNQLEILEAIKLIDDNRFKLTIVGGIKDVDYYKKILKFIKENDMKNISFVGEVKDVNKYFKNADLYVLSSKSEALPTVLIEALENNVPIIANDCKYGPREILEGNKYGLIYRDNYLELRDKILYLINNNIYNRFIENSYLRAKDFEYNNIIMKYSEVLEN
ncbi:glycosyltransferase [Clostridium perfringens]|uniref:glycosyltransferase n=1 Tax=Clostridium perfringens TaxID=1502 RepID=UPI0023B910F0|nr:glycosyltransferase [Clostridium perfringens]